MTDKILTEEEVAKIDRWLDFDRPEEQLWSYAIFVGAIEHTERLVASHRALQERVKDLEAEVQQWRCSRSSWEEND